MIENEPNELTLIYHSDKDNDKKSLAFVQTLTAYKTKSLDLKREKITGTQLAEIAGKMHEGIHGLLDRTYQDQSEIETPEALDDSDLLILLANEPVLINTPIVIIGKNAYQYASAYKILQENTTTEGVGYTASANAEEKRTAN